MSVPRALYPITSEEACQSGSCVCDSTWGAVSCIDARHMLRSRAYANVRIRQRHEHAQRLSQICITALLTPNQAKGRQMVSTKEP